MPVPAFRREFLTEKEKAKMKDFIDPYDEHVECLHVECCCEDCESEARGFSGFPPRDVEAPPGQGSQMAPLIFYSNADVLRAVRLAQEEEIMELIARKSLNAKGRYE